MGKDFESFLLLRPFNNLQGDIKGFPGCFNQLAPVSAIGPHQRQPGQLTDLGHGNEGTVPVLNISLMNVQSPDQALGIYDDMALSAFNLLSRIVTTDPPFEVVLTDWLSMMTALGVSSRPACLLTSRRKVLWILVITPSLPHR